MKWRWAFVPAILLMPVALVPVQAQQPLAPKPAPPQALAPQPCADASTEGRRNSPPSESKPNEDLSQKLAEGNGVLCPPPVDPDIQAPTPNMGRTPIIPAPGTPGGNPSVQPK
jgi:hypothetical protein